MVVLYLAAERRTRRGVELSKPLGQQVYDWRLQQDDKNDQEGEKENDVRRSRLVVGRLPSGPRRWYQSQQLAAPPDEQLLDGTANCNPSKIACDLRRALVKPIWI